MWLVKMHYSSKKLISLTVILASVVISSFGCKNSSKDVQENQTISTLPDSQASPTEPESQVDSTLPVTPVTPTRSATPVTPTAPLTPTTPIAPTNQAANPQVVRENQRLETDSTTVGNPLTNPLASSQLNSNEKVNKTQNLSITNLPDGNYFYGESPQSDEPGQKYLIFRKTGNLIAGQKYLFQTDDSICFQGIAESSTINNVEIAYFEPSKEGLKWYFDKEQPIPISGLHQIDFAKAPQLSTANMQECLKVFQEKN